MLMVMINMVIIKTTQATRRRTDSPVKGQPKRPALMLIFFRHSIGINLTYRATNGEFRK